MGQLIRGTWSTAGYQSDTAGHFVRPHTQFRAHITADGSSGYPAAAGRYHLYISLACPWAHRALIMRRLKGLEDTITLSIVDPCMGEDGWRFSQASGCIPDSVNHARFLREIYVKANPDYSGRVTVPVLWDKQRATIVNNESLDIMRMLDTQFDAFTGQAADYYPEAWRSRIDETIEAIYGPINNGVYRAGFATRQPAYEEAIDELFQALDHWDRVLATQPYLCGDRMTEADWCLFTTLIHFDVVYVCHFKCNWRRIVDYPNLWNYLKALYQVRGVAETCDFGHIKRHYFTSHSHINPTGIVPKGPSIDFNAPHDRDRLTTLQQQD